MSDTEPPPSSGPAEGRNEDSVPPSPRARDSRRRRLEGVIPEIIKRALELGVEKARESPENIKSFVGDMKLPKEIAHYLFAQVDETKNGLFRVVAKEMRDFLEQTNFAGEMQKLLTTVQFEVNTTIRFTPNDGKKKSKKEKAAEDKAKAENKGGEGEDEVLFQYGGDAEGDDDDAPESHESASDPDHTTSLPKPEITSALHVRRDERPKRDK